MIWLWALLGLAAGVGARAWVRSGAFRRAGDPTRAPRLLWAPPAGAVGETIVHRCLADQPWALGVWTLTCALLLVLACVDADVHRLPDVLVRPLALGLLLSAAAQALAARAGVPLVLAVLGGAALFVAFYALALLPGGGMGYGDVKLAGALGIGLGPLGWNALLAAPVLGLCCGGVGAVVLLVTGRARRSSHIALGPYLALGAILALSLADR